jgi:hypothetical protein
MVHTCPVGMVHTCPVGMVHTSPVGMVHTYRTMEMEQTQRSETLALKLQTPVDHPEESI